MEFPEEIKQYILSYLPHPYKNPAHVEAINKTAMFADLIVDRLLTYEIEEEIDGEVDFLWLNSYMEYQKWRHLNSLL